MNIKEKWEAIDNDGDEFLSFNRIENKHSNKRDLHAFITLDKFFPNSKFIVSSAGHDAIYFCPNQEQIESLNDDQILELLRCGIFYDVKYECLAMFI